MNDLYLINQYIASLKPDDLSAEEMRSALDFIRLTMSEYRQTDSFGAIIIFSPGPVLLPVPTIVFGFPQPPPNIRRVVKEPEVPPLPSKGTPEERLPWVQKDEVKCMVIPIKLFSLARTLESRRLRLKLTKRAFLMDTIGT